MNLLWRRVLAVTVLLSIGAIISSCGNPDLVYEDKARKWTEVEQIIENQLELENPGTDLTVDIFHDD